MSRVRFWLSTVSIVLFAAMSLAAQDAVPAQSADRPRLGFVGLHGGMFELIERHAADLKLDVEYLDDDAIARDEVDFSRFDIVYLQHLRDECREAYDRAFRKARQKRPSQRIFCLSGSSERDLPNLVRDKLIERDEQLSRYYGSSEENLRRLLIYSAVRILGRTGEVLPVDEGARIDGLYHPDHDGMFPDVPSFLVWAESAGKPIDAPRRVVIAVHSTHLTFQQPRVVEALIKAFEARGVLAVGMTDGGRGGGGYESRVKEFAPLAIVHTCHSSERVPFREELGIPHVHSIFFRQQSIDEYLPNVKGLGASEQAFQILGQELLGSIEPQIGAGTVQGGGSAEAFTPVEERIAHLADRTCNWMKLAITPNPEKRIAFVYYDREMGKAELMRGSATGMFMNAPRSIVRVFRRMADAGYRFDQVPAHEDQLLAWMQDHGRQIGIWAPGELDRLARSGKAVLIPADRYRQWFEKFLPEPLQQSLIQRWGPPPGKFLVWRNEGQDYIVVPRVDLGNVILAPQPLRGEAHDTSLVHDKLVPPPHNYLATYWWMQEEFGAHAVVHFGTHGTEFLLPGKAAGLSQHDWSDRVIGTLPNINPWVINNLGESGPDRRRAYAVLINHLTPPSVNAELSDELAALHNDIDKWVTLEEGALKEKFRETITAQTLNQRLDQDVHLDLSDGRLLTPDEIQQVLGYLHGLHNETTPVSLHILGEPPRDDLYIPYLATCLRSQFRKALGEIVPVPPGEALTPGDSEKYLLRKSEEIIELIVRRGLMPADAIKSVGGQVPAAGLSRPLSQSFETLQQLVDGFRETPQEIGNLLAALDGKYIPPGPGNSPDRNPAVLPTGRNMYVMNPEEVPSRPSWEIGVKLADNLLKDWKERHGRSPEKIAFTMSAFATFQDYGVMEAEILYLMGVRPVWDTSGLVVDIEVIPREELGRPRVDVFLAAISYYRDLLPTRLKLLDKAIRRIAEIDEPDNPVRAHTLAARSDFVAAGMEAERAEILSKARIFGPAVGENGSAGYYYLVERSGEWDTREELANVYLSRVRNVYTGELWGEPAAEVYNRQIQGTEILLRNWSDRTRSPLSNKYDWYHGGSLSLAIEHLTGKAPEFFFSDVRDPDQSRMVSANDALMAEFRVRLFNRKWIEGMMKEGYAGADQIGVHVSNTLGWSIMRKDAIANDQWEEIVNVYLRDSKRLAIREWFETANPFAFQELTEILLEAARKGYWQPTEKSLNEVAEAYARSVARHGEGGGLRGGGNRKLERFVEQILRESQLRDAAELLASFQSRARELAEANTASVAVGPAPAPRPVAASAPSETPAEPAPASGAVKPSEIVTGRELVAEPPPPAESAAPPQEQFASQWWLVVIVAAAVLVAAGFLTRRGLPHGGPR